MMRKTFLLEMVKVVPEMGKYLLAEYCCDKKMVFDQNVIIKSTLGLVQGKSEGPALCCANEAPILSQVAEMLEKDHMVIALIDDISVIDPQDVAIKVLKFIEILVRNMDSI